jgi:hypothetical protein
MSVVFPSKCRLFITLPFTVQIVITFFINHVLKFQYQHGCLEIIKDDFDDNDNNNNLSVVPILGRLNLFEINLKRFELILQYLTMILPKRPYLCLLHNKSSVKRT